MLAERFSLQRRQTRNPKITANNENAAIPIVRPAIKSGRDVRLDPSVVGEASG